jgi:hypothetical protein
MGAQPYQALVPLNAAELLLHFLEAYGMRNCLASLILERA